jgi:hypothetical protein
MIKLTQLNEAEEIDFNKLDPQRKKQVMAFEKIIGGENQQIWQGIHGYIVDIEARQTMGNGCRLDADDMKKLVSLKVRWVEIDGEIVTIAF